MSLTYRAKPVYELNGSIRVPGDKSISHRSVMLGSIANGTTSVQGFLCGDDALATMNAFSQMGVEIQREGTNLTIKGVGRLGLQQPQNGIDLGNSGTAMRLMMGLLAGQSFSSRLTGDRSLLQRPMKRIASPLGLMGADIETINDKAPIHLKPASLQAIDYTMTIASAQLKSAILLAGLYAKGRTSIIEPTPTRDHTERMLRGFGVKVQVADKNISLKGGVELQAMDIDIPADISSAAFFIVAASIAATSDVLLTHVGINPTRTGIIRILQAMGANISLVNQREIGNEPVADIKIIPTQLKGIDIPEAWVPLAIDELPVVAIAAACAVGTTRLTGAEELRVKESDRLMAIANTLNTLGVKVKEKPDGFIIEGKGKRRNDFVFTGGTVNSYGDHRIAMAATVASLRAKDTIYIEDCDNVATSFPGFISLANSIGFNLS